MTSDALYYPQGLPAGIDFFVRLIDVDPTPSKRGTLFYLFSPLLDQLIKNVFHMYLVTLFGSDYHSVRRLFMKLVWSTGEHS